MNDTQLQIELLEAFFEKLFPSMNWDVLIAEL